MKAEKNRYQNQEHTFFKDRYGVERLHVATVNDEPTMTNQFSKDESDINTIMKKYETTGQFQCHIKQGGAYQDFLQITDFHDMMNTVIYAKEAFQTLPAHVRARFQNDPGQLLEFLQDEKNYDEGVKLGLLNERPQKTQTQTNSQIKNDDTNDDKHFSEITTTTVKKRVPKPE